MRRQECSVVSCRSKGIPAMNPDIRPVPSAKTTQGICHFLKPLLPAMSGESTIPAPKRPIAVGHGRRCTMPVHRSGKNTNDSTVSLNRGPLTALVSMYTSNFSVGKSGTPHGGLRGSRPRRVAIALRNARAPTSQVCFDGPFELMMSWLAGSSDHAFPQRPPARRYRPNFRWVWTCDFWPRSRRVPRANWFLPRRFLEFGS